MRFIYNKLLEMRIKAYQRRKESLSCFECNKRIKSILKKLHPWLGEVNSQALQLASRNLEAAYKNFFQRKEAGFPRFRKQSGRQSFQCPQNCKVDFQKQELYVPAVWRSRTINTWRNRGRNWRGSRNRAKARIRVARIHEKVANQRKDTIEKATSMIVDDNQVDTVCMEDLNVKGMVRNRKLAKSISDASFGFFRMRMEKKCMERGKSFVLAPRLYASSKTCNTCKTRYMNLPLSVREWILPILREAGRT